MNNSIIVTLREALDSIMPVAVFAATERNTNSVYNFVMLRATPSGLVALSGNGAQWLLKNVNQTPAESNMVCLDGVKLRAILGGFKDMPDTQQVNISWDEKGAVVKAGRSKLTLNVIDPSTYPTPERVSKEDVFEVMMDGNALREAVTCCSHAVAHKDSRHYLNGMCFQFKRGFFTVISSDGNRMSRVMSEQANSANDAVEAIVPRRFLDLMSMMPKQASEVRLRMDLRMIELTWDDGQIRSQVVDGKFPETNAHFSMLAEPQFVVSRQDLMSALSRLKATVNETRPAVVLCRDNNELRIATEGASSSDVTGEDFIQAQICDGFSDLSLNIHYLNDALNSFLDAELTFSKSEMGFVLIKGQSDKTDIIGQIKR